MNEKMSIKKYFLQCKFRSKSFRLFSMFDIKKLVYVLISFKKIITKNI